MILYIVVFLSSYCCSFDQVLRYKELDSCLYLIERSNSKYCIPFTGSIATLADSMKINLIDYCNPLDISNNVSLQNQKRLSRVITMQKNIIVLQALFAGLLLSAHGIYQLHEINYPQLTIISLLLSADIYIRILSISLFMAVDVS